MCERGLDQMLADEPRLQFIAAKHVTHHHVIGPLIAAIFMVSWEIFSASKRTSRDEAISN